MNNNNTNSNNNNTNRNYLNVNNNDFDNESRRYSQSSGKRSSTALSIEFLSPINSPDREDSFISSADSQNPTFIFTPPTQQVFEPNLQGSNFLKVPEADTESLKIPHRQKSFSSLSNSSCIQSDSSSENSISTGFSIDVTPKLNRILTEKPQKKPKLKRILNKVSNKFYSPLLKFLGGLKPFIYSEHSLLIFSKESKFRQFCKSIINLRYLQFITNLLVLLDWLVIILKNQYSEKRHVFVIILKCLNAIFLVEIILNSIANGLIFEHKVNKFKKTSFIIEQKIINEFNEVNSYLTNSSNSNGHGSTDSYQNSPYLRKTVSRLDFLSTLAYWILQILIWYSHGYDEESPIVLILQFLNALRPIRLLFFINYFKPIIKTLKLSLPLLKNVTIFILFFFILLSNFGLILFQGTLDKRCRYYGFDEFGNLNKNSTEDPTDIFCYGTRKNMMDPAYTQLGYYCPWGYKCDAIEEVVDDQYKLLTFNNFLSSALIVFITITNQLYSDIMYDTMSTNGWWSSAYYCLIVILFSFWLVELYVAVIGRIFEKIREEEELMKSKGNNKDSSEENESSNWKQFLGFEFHHTIEDPQSIQLNQFNTITGKYESIENYHSKKLKNKTFKQLLKSPARGLPGLIPQRIDYFLLKLLPFLEMISFVLIWLDLILRIALSDDQKWAHKLYTYINFYLLFALLIRIIVKKFPFPPRKVEKLTISDYGDFVLILIPIALNIFISFATDIDVSLYLEAFCIFRVYRVLGIVPGVRGIMSKLSENINSTVRILSFMLALLVLVAPMFMQILKGRVERTSFLEDNENNIMRFDSIQQAILSLIQLLDGEDWPNQLYELSYKLSTSNIIIVAIIMIIWIFLSNFILARMFIAVAMEGFELVRGEKYKIQLNKFIKTIEGIKLREMSYPISNWNPYKLLPPKPLPLKIPSLPSSLKFNLPTHLTNLLIDQPKKQENAKFTPRDYYRSRFYNNHPNYSRSLFFFRPNNRLRKFFQFLTDRKKFSLIKNFAKLNDIRVYYHIIIWSAIIGSTIVGALDSPNVRYNYLKNGVGNSLIYWKFNLCFSIILTLEFLFLIIANGFLFAPKAYLRGFWNRIDLLVLVLQVVDVILTYKVMTSSSRVFHILVSLRALRLATRTKTLKRTLYSIFIAGFVKLMTVILILLAFIVPFAVLGKAMFGDKMQMCNLDHESIIKMQDCVGSYLKDDGILMPKVWSNPYMYSFDSLGSSLILLIELASREKWIDVMKSTMNIVDKESQPRDEISWWHCLYFVVYFFGVQLIGISTFIAVIINNHREFTGIAEISEDEKNWIDLKKQLNQVKPSKKMVNYPSDLGLKRWCFKIVTDKRSWWNRMITLTYFSIFILVMAGYYQMSETWRLIRLWLIIGCLCLSAINEAIQLYGRGSDVYLANPINTIFLVINIIAILLQISLSSINLANVENTLQSINISDYDKYGLTVIFFKKLGFCLTLVVSMKLIVKLDPLLQLIYILKASLKDILELAYVWFVIFVIFAIAMNQGFGGLKWGKNMSYYVNANDYLAIFLMLFRISTGEGWNDIMYDFKVQAPNCVLKDNYLESDCGDPWLATILFISFHTISVYIFSSMFVVFLLDTFSYCYEIFASFSFISRQDLREFKRNWSRVDPLGLGYVQKPDLIRLLKGLETPFKIRLFPMKFNPIHMCSEYNRKYKEKFGHVGWKRGTPPSEIDPEVLKDYCKWLNKQLDLLKTSKLKQRKDKFNLIYIECCQLILHSKGKGLEFNKFLLLIAQYKIIDPMNCFLLSEIIPYQQHQEKIQNMYNKQKILGLFMNYMKRWRARRVQIYLPKITLGTADYQSDDSDPENEVNGRLLTPVRRIAPNLKLSIPKPAQNYGYLSSPNSSSPEYSPISYYNLSGSEQDRMELSELDAELNRLKLEDNYWKDVLFQKKND